MKLITSIALSVATALSLTGTAKAYPTMSSWEWDGNVSIDSYAEDKETLHTVITEHENGWVMVREILSPDHEIYQAPRLRTGDRVNVLSVGAGRFALIETYTTDGHRIVGLVSAQYLFKTYH